MSIDEEDFDVNEEEIVLESAGGSVSRAFKVVRNDPRFYLKLQTVANAWSFRLVAEIP